MNVQKELRWLLHSAYVRVWLVSASSFFSGHSHGKIHLNLDKISTNSYPIWCHFLIILHEYSVQKRIWNMSFAISFTVIFFLHQNTNVFRVWNVWAWAMLYQFDTRVAWREKNSAHCIIMRTNYIIADYYYFWNWNRIRKCILNEL